MTCTCTITENGPLLWQIKKCRLCEAAPELYEVLKLVTPSIPAKDARCHLGLTTQDKCVRCSRIIRAHAAIAAAEAK